jgi:hypothetical protein
MTCLVALSMSGARLDAKVGMSKLPFNGKKRQNHRLLSDAEG